VIDDDDTVVIESDNTRHKSPSPVQPDSIADETIPVVQPVVTNTPLAAGSVTIPPNHTINTGVGTANGNVRFGLRRTRNQLCRKLEEIYRRSPDRFHAKIDSMYAQYLAKTATNSKSTTISGLISPKDEGHQ
jgi:hypothetical protein